jgi:hypothetical protein
MKPSKVFTQLCDHPEVFGQLTQICTMHRYNPHYYVHFLKAPYNPEFPTSNCICNHHLPPFPAKCFHNHVLHNCEEYTEHRHLLSAVSHDHCPIILLGSTKGLLATAKLLCATGAFIATGKPYEPPHFPDILDFELVLHPP